MLLSPKEKEKFKTHGFYQAGSHALDTSLSDSNSDSARSLQVIERVEKKVATVIQIPDKSVWRYADLRKEWLHRHSVSSIILDEDESAGLHEIACNQLTGKYWKPVTLKIRIMHVIRLLPYFLETRKKGKKSFLNDHSSKIDKSEEETHKGQALQKMNILYDSRCGSTLVKQACQRKLP